MNAKVTLCGSKKALKLKTKNAKLYLDKNITPPVPVVSGFDYTLNFSFQ